MPEATFNNVLGTKDVGVVIRLPGTAHTGNTADVKDSVNTFAGRDHGLSVTKIGGDNFGAGAADKRIVLTTQRADAITTSNQLLNNIQSQKTVCPGYKRIHGNPFPNHFTTSVGAL